LTHARFDLSRFLTSSIVAHYCATVAEKAGFCVTRSTNSLKAKRLEVLSGLGIEVALDVGANKGQWASELRRSGYLGKIISFEPSPEPFAQLQTLARCDQQHACVQAGLGSRDGTAQLLTTSATVNSSFRNPVHRPNLSSGIEVEGQVTVLIRRLDSVLPSLASETDRFYLKIDTQGFEREVLTGAPDTLSRTDAVEIELSLLELYEGQGLLPEVWELLVSSGLRPAWIERGYRESGDIWLLQVDGLFVREKSWKARSKNKSSKLKNGMKR
jgi:FkbM family methyltransferase